MSIRRQQQQLCFKIKPDGLKNFDWGAVVSTNEYLDRKNKFFAKEHKKWNTVLQFIILANNQQFI